MKASEAPLSITQTFSCSANLVWNAISDRDEMIKWFFDNIPAFEASVGFKTCFVIENEGRLFTHQWEITQVRPGSLLAYSWDYAEYSGRAIIYFRLTGNSPTTLSVEMIVTEDFPDGVPEFEWESCQSGWDYFINERLTEYLSSR